MRLLEKNFWWGWAGGIATCGLVAAIAASAVMFGGIYNTGADNPHIKPVAWAIHQTMMSSVRKRAGSGSADPPIDGALVLEGAKVYEAHCIACHGGPGVARAPWAAAMLPTPPFLIDSAKHWNRAQVHEIIAHGVKMTGMPAWEDVLPRRQVEAVTALCAMMPQFGVPQFEELRNAARAGPTTPLDASGPAASIAPKPLGETQPFSRTAEQVPTGRPGTAP
jgi:mono/diheme cytochrome c family protein